MNTKIFIAIAGAAALPACNTTTQEEITQNDPAAPPIPIVEEPQEPKVGLLNRNIFRVPDPTKDLVGADTSPRPRRDPLPGPTGPSTPGPLPVLDLEHPGEAPLATPGPTPLPEAATTDSPEGAPVPTELPGSPGPVLGLAN